MTNQNIIIITGGTGGHIFPARTIALALCEKGYKVTILADKNYFKYHKKDDPFNYKIISSSQAQKNIFALIKMGFKIAWGILSSLFFMINFRPKIVIAFGGYATFPSLISAIILRKKIILHEQNAYLGKVNRLFAGFADIIALSYKETSGIENKYLSKTKFTGNPVREEIISLSQNEYKFPNFQKPIPNNKNNLGYNVLLASQFREPKKTEINNHFNILVIGGSGGAKIFSEVLPKAFFNIREELKNHLNITQQCREEDLPSVYIQYKSFNLTVLLRPFFDDMKDQIEKAHLIIARAGSSSIAEFTAAGKPMILIPFAKASDNHQEKNALFIEKMGGAILIRESELLIPKVTDNLERLIDNPEILSKMSRSSFSCATLEATDNLLKLIASIN